MLRQLVGSVRLSKQKKSTKISLGDVAKAAGVSKATACYVLRNSPGPSKETRTHVLKVARKLGYAPDARMATRMAHVRETKAKEYLPIAWIHTHPEKDAWQKYKFYSPYLDGARDYAQQVGYRLEEIWSHQPGLTMRRISQILYQRGMEGVIVTQPALHLRLNWNFLSAVSIESSLLAPRLHGVCTDQFFNFQLALKVVKRFGYRRIGICLEDNFARYMGRAIFISANYFCMSTPPVHRVPPVFYDWGREGGAHEQMASKKVVDWIRRHKPEVMVGHSNRLVDWANAAGYRVPQDIGVVHLANDDDVSDWAGINSHRRQIGAVAAERVISLMQHRQFGVPESPVSMMIRGTWCSGKTLLTPKPKVFPLGPISP